MDPTTMSAQQVRQQPAQSHGRTSRTLRAELPADTIQPASLGLPAQRNPQWGGPSAAGSRESPEYGIPARTTVLIADPLAVSRTELSTALAGSGIGRVIQADTVHGVEGIIAGGLQGQLALVSLGFGDPAYRLIHRLRQGLWQRVIALAPTVDPDPLVAALQAGASGVLRGRPGSPDENPGKVHQLTPREIEVLSLVADGRSNKWIAEQLALSALTVKSHLARISRKLGTGDRSHLVAIALRAGAIH
jgi:DNA-binding NarL/FixJ family response regulator